MDGLAIALALLSVPGEEGCCALSLLGVTLHTRNGAEQGLVKLDMSNSYFWTTDTKKNRTGQGDCIQQSSTLSLEANFWMTY